MRCKFDQDIISWKPLNAAAMIYVGVEELIPAAQQDEGIKTDVATIGCMLEFASDDFIRYFRLTEG